MDASDLTFRIGEKKRFYNRGLRLSRRGGDVTSIPLVGEIKHVYNTLKYWKCTLQGSDEVLVSYLCG